MKKSVAEKKIAYFDMVADSYFQRYYKNLPGGYGLCVRKQKVIDLLDKHKGRVLDVGCGPGIMVQELINLGFEFWGIDASARMIEQCRNSYVGMENVHFLTGEASNLKFSDGFFDLVICMGVIDHIEKYELAISEMLRVIKEDGTLIITFPNLYSPFVIWRTFIFSPIVHLIKRIYYSFLRRPQPPSTLFTFTKLHSERGATELVKRYSGEVTDVVYFHFNVLLSPLDEIFPRLTLWTIKRLERYGFVKLRWLANSFIMKVKKKQKEHIHVIANKQENQ